MGVTTRAGGAGVLAGGLSIVGLAAALPPGGLGFPTCLFRLMSGMPCPSCGLTRSFAAITAADWHRAVEAHPLGPCVFLALLAVMGAAAVQMTTGRGLLERLWARTRGPGLLIAGAAFLAHWAILLAS